MGTRYVGCSMVMISPDAAERALRRLKAKHGPTQEERQELEERLRESIRMARLARCAGEIHCQLNHFLTRPPTWQAEERAMSKYQKLFPDR